MNYKNIIIFTITLILIFSTTLIKNKTKDLEEKIYLTRESISKKKSEYQIMLLEYNYLTSPEKLMEYHRLYFDDNLMPLKIDDLKQIEFNKNSFEIKKLDKFCVELSFHQVCGVSQVPICLTLIIGDCANVLGEMIKVWQTKKFKQDDLAISKWWKQIEEWRAKECLKYNPSSKVIKPQYALQRLYQATRGKDTYITTEVGQHQMWAAQYFHFDHPNRWMTSGGLGTMGYGFPAAIGVQVAHPKATVIDVAGEASFLMNMQELSTAVQYRLPVKIFILNNRYMGMVRQWQELLYGGRYSESYSDSLPDFVKLAEAYGAKGLRALKPEDVDLVIDEMLNSDQLTIADIVVDETENCFPMIPSGAPHNEMLLGPADEAEKPVSEAGMVLV